MFLLDHQVRPGAAFGAYLQPRLAESVFESCLAARLLPLAFAALGQAPALCQLILAWCCQPRPALPFEPASSRAGCDA